VVDHEGRRRELAAAVWRVISRDGVEGVSIRDVAAESGWSAGALRHYFRTREELLAFAAHLVYERVAERLAGRGRAAATLTDAVREVLVEVIPLDADRRTEAAVWLAFVTRSLVDGRIALEQRVAFDGLRELCGRVMDEVAAHGSLAPGLRPDVEATRLHALLDGLTLHLLMGRLAPADALAALDAHLAEVIRETATP
jgi:AcrR family transcriptional regulator